MAIRILDELLINKIAAGEVVERPASVVKELVENALDAGAASLRVALRAGGRNLIRVVDDGSGMNRTDALMCTERHATSKIRSEEDLFKVGTLGFRGEAIPSIAAVSRFELLTRPAGSEVGTRVTLEGGKLLDVEPAGCAPGTEISVASLFFNVPARRKFLRSVDTELAHCVEAVTREALIRPSLDLEVTHDDRSLVRAPAVTSRARRAADLLGAHGEALVPVAFRRGALEVDALVSPVGVHRATPTGCTWLYVNGRFVKDLVLRRAVTQAYAGIVPKDRYPVVILEVRIPPEDVDVNVHPAKTEVRFVRSFELQNAVAEGLRGALQEHGIRRPVATEARYRPAEGPSDGQGGAPRAVQAPLWSTDAAEAPRPAAPPMTPSFGARPATAPASTVRPGGGWSAGWAPARPSSPGPTPSFAEAPGDRPPDAPPVPEAPTPTGAVPPSSAPLPAPVAADDPPPSLAPPSLAPPSRLLPVPRFRDLRVIGQLAGTYVLCEGGGELVVIDQHAAHERVTLHRLRRDPTATLGGGQRLLTPVLLDLPVARARALAGHVDALGAWGLEVSAMGGRTFAVHAVPAPLQKADLASLLADVADEVAEGGPPQAPGERLDHFLATLACHTSVRAGQVLSAREMEGLLRELDEVDFSVCAHGRPVAIRLGADELERRFHRA